MTVSACARLSRRLPPGSSAAPSRPARSTRGGASRPRSSWSSPTASTPPPSAPTPRPGPRVARGTRPRPGGPAHRARARYDPCEGSSQLPAAAARLRGRVPGVHFLLCGDKVDRGNAALARTVESLGPGRSLPPPGAAPRHRPDPGQPRPRHVILDQRGLPAVPRRGHGLRRAPAWRRTWGIRRRSSGRPAGSCPRDSQALAGAWSELLASGPTAGGRWARRRDSGVLERFDLGAITRRYEDLYARLAFSDERSPAGAGVRRNLARSRPRPSAGVIAR